MVWLLAFYLFAVGPRVAMCLKCVSVYVTGRISQTSLLHSSGRDTSRPRVSTVTIRWHFAAASAAHVEEEEDIFRTLNSMLLLQTVPPQSLQ